MIKWLKKKIISWVREDWENARYESSDAKLSSSNSLASPIVRSRKLEQNGMSFTLHTANGGYVMEYYTYDPRTDERKAALHIITSDQDLGQGIAHIITLEMLRK